MIGFKKKISSSKKNILVVGEMMGYGGMSTFIEESAEQLTQGDYYLHLLTVSSHPLDDDFLHRFGKFKTIYHKQIESYDGFINKLKIFYYSLALFVSAIREIEFNVIWFNVPISTIACMFYPLSWKIPRLYFFHGPLDLELYKDYFSNMKHKNLAVRIHVLIYYVMNRLALMLVEHVLTYSFYARNLLQTHYHVQSKKIHIVPGFLNKKRIILLDVYRQKLLRKQLGIDNKFVFFFPSRFEPRKNPEVVLQALSILRNPRILVIFCGHFYKSYFFKWLAWAHQHDVFKYITFYPDQSRPVLFNLYQCSDVVLYTSANLEMFGFVPLESFTFGIPVIGTQAGAIPEMLEKADKRLLIEENNPQQLATKMRWLIKLNNRQKQLLKRKCLDTAIKYNSKRNQMVLVNFLSSILSS